MRVRALALFGAAALTFGTAANATITISTPPTSPASLTATATSSGAGGAIAFSDSNLPSTFDDIVGFTNTLAGLYTASLTTSTPGLIFTSAILSGGGFSYALTNQGLASSLPNQLYGLPSAVTLPSGSYTLEIKGTDPGFGSLAGTITSSALPEPGTWALMLLGFGAIGIAIRSGRKRGFMRLAQASSHTT
jgi:hypothetical protein